MFNKMLLPFDGLPQTLASVRFASKIAEKTGTELHLLHIITDAALLSAKKNACKDDIKAYCKGRIQGHFEQAMPFLENANHIFSISFAKDVETGIIEYIRKNKIGLCILHPSPYHLSEHVGDMTKKIAKKISIPSLFIKTGTAFGQGDVLYPVDENPENLSSLPYAIYICKAFGLNLIIYHTTWKNPNIKKSSPKDHVEESVLENIACIEKAARREKISSRTIIECADTIENGIISCAVRNAVELIIMTQSTSILGGKSELVLYHSMYPLLQVPK